MPLQVQRAEEARPTPAGQVGGFHGSEVSQGGFALRYLPGQVLYFPDVEGGSDIDDAMLEFKAGERPSKAQFEALVAGIEATLPRLKGRIPWARAALSGWQVTHTPRHTVPMTRTVGQWFAVHFVGLGHERIAAGIMVQRAVALRPSELLGIR